MNIKSLLPIYELGNPILRKKAADVADVKDPDIQQLIDRMLETCGLVQGVGISAPQVGHSIRLFIVASKPNSRYPDAPHMEPMAIINPTIISTSEKMEKDWEGCLSVPGIRGLVPRPTSVTFSFTSRLGEPEERTFDGFIARVFLHEYDHIEGTIFLDLADPKELVTDKEYYRILDEQRRTSRIRKSMR